MKTMLTVDDILALGPCREYRVNGAKLLRDLVGDGITLEDALRLEEVSPDDRVWLACYVLPWEQLHSVIKPEVDRVVRKHCLSCKIEPVEVWAEQWLHGEAPSSDSTLQVREQAIMSAKWGTAHSAISSALSLLRHCAWDAVEWAALAEDQDTAVEAAYCRVLDSLLTNELQEKEERNE